MARLHCRISSRLHDVGSERAIAADTDAGAIKNHRQFVLRARQREPQAVFAGQSIGQRGSSSGRVLICCSPSHSTSSPLAAKPTRPARAQGRSRRRHLRRRCGRAVQSRSGPTPGILAQSGGTRVRRVAGRQKRVEFCDRQKAPPATAAKRTKGSRVRKPAGCVAPAQAAVDQRQRADMMNKKPDRQLRGRVGHLRVDAPPQQRATLTGGVPRPAHQSPASRFSVAKSVCLLQGRR